MKEISILVLMINLISQNLNIWQVIHGSLHVDSLIYQCNELLYQQNKYTKYTLHTLVYVYRVYMETTMNYLPKISLTPASHSHVKGLATKHTKKGLFFQVTLTPNRYIIHVIVIGSLYRSIPCIPMYTLYTHIPA